MRLKFLLGTVLIVCLSVCCTAHAAPITLDVTHATITAWKGNQAIVARHVEEEDGSFSKRVDLAAGNVSKRSVLASPPLTDVWALLPFQSDSPEFLIAQEDCLLWVAFREEGLVTLRTYPPQMIATVSSGGILLSSYNPQTGSGHYQFLDFEGNAVLSAPNTLPESHVFDMIWEDTGWILSLAPYRGDPCTFVLRKMDRSGSVLWDCPVEVPYSFSGKIFSDGQGGAWLSYSEDYDEPETLLHVNASGVIDMQHQIGGERRVTTLHCSQVTGEHVTLYGTSMANSKGIYDVFALTLDRTGHVIALDVREFDDRHDDNLTLQRSADGIIYVCSQSSPSYPPILIPFSELSVVESHGIVLHTPPA